MCRVMMVEMMNLYCLSVHYVYDENIIEPISQAQRGKTHCDKIPVVYG